MNTLESPPRLPSAWSDYLLWMSFAVPGMLNRGNVDAMAHALQHMPREGSMLEIGSFCGLSTCVLSYLRRKHAVTAPFFTCDRWSFEGQELGAPLGDAPNVTHDDYRTFVRESFLRNARTFCKGDEPRTIEKDSDEFFDAWKRRDATHDVFGRAATLGGPLNFCYIDGNHTYGYARRDFDNTDHALVAGGFVLFDDSGDGSQWDVNRVVQDVLKFGAYLLVAKAPNYLLQKQR